MRNHTKQAPHRTVIFVHSVRSVQIYFLIIKKIISFVYFIFYFFYLIYYFVCMLENKNVVVKVAVQFPSLSPGEEEESLHTLITFCIINIMNAVFRRLFVTVCVCSKTRARPPICRPPHLILFLLREYVVMRFSTAL